MVAISSPFRAIATSNRVLAVEAAGLAPAVTMAQRFLAQLDLAASRFRAHSELSTLNEAARQADVTATVGPLLGECLQAALDAAAFTGGLVDPTVGSALEAIGYDADIDTVRARDPAEHPALALALVPGWRTVGYEPASRVVSLRRGTVLDLGATAKAYAADAVAQRLAATLGGGFLVDFGGDLAVAGAIPDGGWRVGVEDASGRTRQVVTSHGTALATSSTRLRAWRHDGRDVHHIVDPRTAASAGVVWAQVTCAHDTALLANAASTAAVVLGEEAPAWLRDKGIQAALRRVDGTTELTCGWPAPQRSVA